jgi:hypothetical protein
LAPDVRHDEKASAGFAPEFRHEGFNFLGAVHWGVNRLDGSDGEAARNVSR